MLLLNRNLFNKRIVQLILFNFGPVQEVFVHWSCYLFNSLRIIIAGICPTVISMLHHSSNYSLSPNKIMKNATPLPEIAPNARACSFYTRTRSSGAPASVTMSADCDCSSSVSLLFLRPDCGGFREEQGVPIVRQSRYHGGPKVGGLYRRLCHRAILA